MTSRYEQLRQECIAFHSRHPEVWDAFCRLTHRVINRGFQNYSARAIFQQIRWETDMGELGSDNFKINDHHSPFYARAFMRRYPQYAGFFRLREQRSRGTPASRLPPLGPADFPYVGDE